MASFQERLKKLSPEKRELLELFLRKEVGISSAKTFVPPLPGLEHILAGVWSDVLHLSEIGRDDDYFELGGDSILLIHIVARAKQQGVSISVHDVFEHSTIARLAAAVERAFVSAPSPYDSSDSTTEPAVKAVPDNEVEDIYPLTPMQEGMLYETLRDAGGLTYRVQWSFEAHGVFHRQAFEKAWRACVERHSVLRTAIRFGGREEPEQVVFRTVDTAIRYEDWSELPGPQRADKWDAARETGLHDEIGWRHPPLLRIGVFRISPDTHYLLWSHHHIIMDGWSHHLLLGEMARLYREFVEGTDPAPAPAPSYRAYVKWVLAQQRTEDRSFWRGHLQGLARHSNEHRVKSEEHRLVADGSNGAPSRLAAISVHISETATRSLADLAKANRLTVSVLVQAAWSLALAQFGGRDRVSYGLTLSGRSGPVEGVDRMLGLFINTLPMVVEIAADRAILPWLSELMAKQTALVANEAASPAYIRRAAGLSGEVRLFESVVVVENISQAPMHEWASSGLSIEGLKVRVDEGQGLVLVAHPGRCLGLEIKRDPSRLTSTEASLMLSFLRQALEQLPSVGAHESPSGFRQMLADWQRTARMGVCDVGAAPDGREQAG